jgi:hypothetical protein
MQLLGILLARVTAISHLYEWDPHGRVYVPDFIKAIVERYGFRKFPKTLEEYNLQTGAIFAVGKIGDIVIDAYTIFQGGLVVDTRSSTENSEKVLADITDWFCEFAGTKRMPDRISRRFYLSQLSFRSDAKLEALNPRLRDLASSLDEVVSRYAKRKLEFETTGISFQFDLDKGPAPSPPLRIERLENSPFEENKYFSAAPLPTDEHISFLTEFESILKS